MKRHFFLPALVTAAVVLSPAAIPSPANPVSFLAGGGGAVGPQQPTTPSIDSSGTCLSTHTFSSGVSLFQTCFTADGNVAQFKVGANGGPFEYIRWGVYGEGYSVCSSAGVSGYDVMGFGEAGFDNPVVVQPGGTNTFPLTITRTTTDGRFSLEQKFSAGGSRTVTMTMSLKNTSGADLTGVKLARTVDADVITAPTNNLNDDVAVTTRRSTEAFDNPGGGNISLTATSRGRTVATSVGNFSGGPWTSCDPFGGTSVYGPADSSMRVTYNLGTVNAGATRVVAFTYTGD